MQFGKCCLLAIVAVTQVCTLSAASVDENSIEPEEPIVQLKDGTVRGMVVEADGRRKVNFYQGIRFGRAERFHKPTPVEPWVGVYDATKPRFSCPQPEFTDITSNLTTSEDCLFLNVWQPTTPAPKSNRSVMVWIYGGGFSVGSIFSAVYDAKQISGLGDVIVVAVNYRLGPLGFANFGTKETPGNLGFHDQILGLKWVQNNIRQFGGNPEDVTIFGESAGSMSVGVLVLSPLTTGLFHRAISQSGTPNTRFVTRGQKDSIQQTIRFARQMGCNVEDLELSLKCLQNKTSDELIKSAIADFSNIDSFHPVFGDEVLPIDPALALKKFDKKIDFIFGVCRNEGTLFMGMMFPEIDMKNITVESAKKKIEQILVKSKIPNKNEFSSIVDYYTKNLTKKSSENELRIAVSDVAGDCLLICPTILFGEQIARRFAQKNDSNNHFYAYRLMAPFNTPLMPTEDWMGVTHGQDVLYLFGFPIAYNGILPSITKAHIQLSRDMIYSWTQFAKTGKMPALSGVQWTEAIDQHNPEQSSVRYFSLDSADYKMVDNYWKVTCDQLWKSLI